MGPSVLLMGFISEALINIITLINLRVVGLIMMYFAFLFNVGLAWEALLLETLSNFVQLWALLKIWYLCIFLVSTMVWTCPAETNNGADEKSLYIHRLMAHQRENVFQKKMEGSSKDISEKVQPIQEFILRETRMAKQNSCNWHQHSWNNTLMRMMI